MYRCENDDQKIQLGEKAFMDIYNTGVLNDELLHCDNLEDLKKEILPKLQEQRTVWKQKIEQIMQENHYSCKEMARLCKVSEPTVRKWCKGSFRKAEICSFE